MKLIMTFVFLCTVFLSSCSTPEIPEPSPEKDVKTEGLGGAEAFMSIAPSPNKTRRFSGMGKKFYTPSAFDLSASITSVGAEIQNISDTHSSSVDSIKKYLQTIGDSEITITPSRLTITRDRYKSEIDHFQFVTRFDIRCRNIKLLSSLQVQLVKLGINGFGEVSMFTENSHKIQNEARQLAIADAKSKADFLKTALGWKDYRISDITLNDSSYSQNRQHAGSFGSRSGGDKRNAANTQTVGATAFIQRELTITIEIIQ